MESEGKAIKKLGGRRPGAGRKKLAVSPAENVKAAIKKALKKDPKAMTEIWQKVIDEAKKGSERHIQILFSYSYGKPIESVEVNTKQLILKRIIIEDGNS